MNDNAGHDSGNLIGNSNFSEIIKGLRQQPLYLLIFALPLTALALCVYAFTVVNDANLRFLAVGGFFIMGLAAFLVLRSVEVGKARQRVSELENQLKAQVGRVDTLSSELEREDDKAINLSNQDIKEHFISAISNTRKALTYKNPTFHEELEAAVATFEKGTGEWSNGGLITDSFDYEKILLGFYRHATERVFATSNEYYMNLWSNKDRSKKIIDAHKIAYEPNKATVTRVFVFSSLDKIDAECLAVIEQQERLKFVTTKVLITDDYDQFPLPPSLRNDFVIIDRGLPTEAIGIESSIDLSSVGAKWIFSGDPKIERTAEWMDQVSISFEDLKSRMEPTP